MELNRKQILIISLSLLGIIIYTLIILFCELTYFYTSLVKFIIFLTIPFLYFFKYREKDLFKINNIKLQLLLGLITCIFIILGYIILNKLFDPSLIVGNLKEDGITKSTYPFVFLYIVLFNALLEEIYFRGFIFLGLKNNIKIAHIYSAVLFSLYHIVIMDSWFSSGVLILLIVGLLFTGFIFNYFAYKSKNIYGGLFIHMGANLGINLIGAYMIYFVI